MQKREFLKTLGLAAFGGAVGAMTAHSNSDVTTAPRESVYERVIRSGKIRCGYAVWAPFMIKDPNSGKLSGISYDVTEELGRRLNLKIEWGQESGFGGISTDLQTDRYDLLGFTIWPNANRARAMDFTSNLFFSGINIYVRANDKRFDGNINAINSPNVKIATIDGTVQLPIIEEDFPNAAIYSMPQLSDDSQLMLSVAQGKADVTLADRATASEYMTRNPGQLKELNRNPIRVFRNTFATRKSEQEFKNMIDAVLQEMVDSGFIHKIVAKYEKNPQSFFPVATPYQLAPAI